MSTCVHPQNTNAARTEPEPEVEITKEVEKKLKWTAERDEALLVQIISAGTKAFLTPRARSARNFLPAAGEKNLGRRPSLYVFSSILHSPSPCDVCLNYPFHVRILCK